MPENYSDHRCPMGMETYTVRYGDNLYGIAVRFGTTVRAILNANPRMDPDRLYVGQQICVPRRAHMPTCTGEYYYVRYGDSFRSIARRFGVNVQDLMAANPNVNPYSLYAGQRICIPRGRRERRMQ